MILKKFDFIKCNLKILIILFQVLGNTSFSASLLQNSESYKNRNKLIVGTKLENFPYEYFENGKIVGFDIELMEEIAKELGYEIEWREIGKDQLINAVKDHEVDLAIAGLALTEKNKKKVEFTIPYIKDEKNCYLVVDNSNNSILSKNDLKNKRTGFDEKSILDECYKGIEGILIPYIDTYAVLSALEQKDLNAAIVSEIIENNLNSNLKILEKVEGKNLSTAIAFSKKNKELGNILNKVIEMIQNSPKYDELYKKYFKQKEIKNSEINFSS